MAHVSVGREWGAGDAWVAGTDSWNGRVSPRMGPTWYGAENFSATSINPFLCWAWLGSARRDELGWRFGSAKRLVGSGTREACELGPRAHSRRSLIDRSIYLYLAYPLIKSAQAFD